MLGLLSWIFDPPEHEQEKWLHPESVFMNQDNKITTILGIENRGLDSTFLKRKFGEILTVLCVWNNLSNSLERNEV